MLIMGKIAVRKLLFLLDYFILIYLLYLFELFLANFTLLLPYPIVNT